MLLVIVFSSCKTYCEKVTKEHYPVQSPYFEATFFDTYGVISLCTDIPICDNGKHFFQLPACRLTLENKEIERGDGLKCLIFEFAPEDYDCVEREFNKGQLVVRQPFYSH